MTKMPPFKRNVSDPLLSTNAMTNIAVICSLDDPEVYHGAPVAIQVIGRRLSEERTLAVAAEIARLVGASTER
jgi:Asp-tRNA(Asn)/Glu-tRNA(Gln) amidotransferase A subunit family amidase